MGMVYLLLASDHEPVARGVLEGSPAEDALLLRILDRKADAAAEHEIILLVGTERGEPPLQCHLLERRGDLVVLKKMMTLNPELRRILRIPVQFDSFVYPLSGSWRGRKSLRSIDLSGGGIAFYSTPGLEIGETAEVVVPVTANPLIVRMQILRKQELKNERTYYAAKFIDLQQEEEQLLCEAVFGIQLKNRPRTVSAREREELTE